MENISKFLKASPEEREQMTINSMWGAVEKACEIIARARRSAEIAHGITTEEFDMELNALCEKAHEHYCNMNKGEMAAEMLLEIIKRQDLDDLLDL